MRLQEFPSEGRKMTDPEVVRASHELDWYVNTEIVKRALELLGLDDQPSDPLVGRSS